MSKKFLNKPHWKLGNLHVFDHMRTTNDRRVISRAKNNNNDDKNKDWGSSIRAHFQAEDIDIGNIGGPSRPGNTFNYRKNPSSADIKLKKKLWVNPTGWYKIKMPNGNRYDKQLLQETLYKIVNPLLFWPIAWKSDEADVSFYVNDHNVAEKLYEVEHAIEMPDGFKLVLIVKFGTPNVKINGLLKAKMKLAMMRRYNPVTKSLDLTRFHYDPLLKDYFCALYKPAILFAVVDIISEYISEVETLNLNNNNLQYIWLRDTHIQKLKNVKILNLAQNKLRDVLVLDGLVAMPLVELRLQGNPICNKLNEKGVYISEVRNRFPKLVRLDDMWLPPPIVFDIEDKPLPSSSQTFLCNAQSGQLIREFLEQYYQVFDSNNRQMLVQAYHDNAIFSMTMAYPYENKDRESNWLNWYATDNRNLIMVTDSERRFKLLKKGPKDIVSFLKDMPMTSHDLINFKVDLTVFMPLMMSLSVSGMFKEIKSGHKNPPIRSFSRTLVIIPSGNGYCICNEELHITNATEDQIKIFKYSPMPPLPDLTLLHISIPDESVPNETLPDSPLALDVTVPNAPLALEVTVPNETVLNLSVSDVPLALEDNGIDNLTKQLEALSMQSGMNLEWSSKCLQENAWNFHEATRAFNQLHKKGVIPAEAFMK